MHELERSELRGVDARKEKKRKEKKLGMDDALGVFDGMVSEDLDPVVAPITDDDAFVEVHCNSNRIAELTIS